MTIAKFTPLLALLLSGCASSSQTYATDGRAAYSLNCSGTVRNWGACEQRAGEICQSAGYDVLSRTGERGAMASASQYGAFATSTVMRTMLIACRRGKAQP